MDARRPRRCAPSRRTAGRRCRSSRAPRPRPRGRGRRRPARASGSCRRARASSRPAGGAHRSATSRPTGVEPVKQTKSPPSTTAPPITGPSPTTTCHRASGSPASTASARDPQGGQRGLRVGLVHDGVAGEERRDRVGDGQGQRVVPGRRRCPRRPWGGAARARVGQHRREPGVPHRREVAAGACARSGARSARRRRAPRRRAAAPCRSRAGPGRGPRPGGRARGRAAAGRPRRARPAAGPPTAAGRPAPRRTPCATSSGVDTGSSASGSPVNGCARS